MTRLLFAPAATCSNGRHHTTCALIFVVVLCGSCKEQERLRDDERVKTVVQTDRKLEAQEQEVLARRGALQRERLRIRDQRVQLITKKMTLGEGDAEGIKALEQEESKLVNLEAGLVEQEVELNKKLQRLVVEKSSLTEKLSADTAKAVLFSRREYSVASREKDLGRREAELARREKVLAEREQALAVRQARVCPRVATTTVVERVTVPPAGGRNYTRGDVEPVYRAALKAMRVKGLLAADLPAGVDRLITETRHAVSKKDYVRAKFAADQLLSSVRSIRIDRSFIGAKIARLSAALRRRPLQGKQKSDVTALFQQTTALYGDGRFSQANGKLNRIYELLK